MRRIQILASKLGARLFRNNVGVLRDADGRSIRVGLCTGSSDLIGWIPLKVSPLMVGRTLAVFTAVEVKSPKGRVSQEQEQFIEAVLAAGGLAVVSRNEQEFAGWIHEFKSGS